MNMSKDQEYPKNIKLQEECNIYTILSLKEQILDVAKDYPNICLDMSEVERIDACFLQLLHATNNYLYDKQGSLVLKNIPQELITLSEKTCTPLPSKELLQEQLGVSDPQLSDKQNQPQQISQKS